MHCLDGWDKKINARKGPHWCNRLESLLFLLISSITNLLKARLILSCLLRWTPTPCPQHFPDLNKDFWNTCRQQQTGIFWKRDRSEIHWDYSGLWYKMLIWKKMVISLLQSWMFHLLLNLQNLPEISTKTWWQRGVWGKEKEGEERRQQWKQLNILMQI